MAKGAITPTSGINEQRNNTLKNHISQGDQNSPKNLPGKLPETKGKFPSGKMSFRPFGQPGIYRRHNDKHNISAESNEKEEIQNPQYNLNQHACRGRHPLQPGDAPHPGSKLSLDQAVQAISR